MLAAQTPGLPEALARVQAEGWSQLILDRRVVVCDRPQITTTSKKGTTIDAWYSGGTHLFAAT